jgi:hypothetical protein
LKGYVEKIINEYPQMVRERERLKKQLESCEFLSAEELIDAMSFSHPEGEHVQSSNISDKTAKVAMEYQERLEKINNELIEPMQKRYDILDEEITFFEESVRGLPENMADVMAALFLEGVTWDNAEYSFCMNRRTIADCRKKAIACLVRMYQGRASMMEAILLA